MSLNILQEIERVYKQYEYYAERINEVGLSDRDRSELWLLMKERLDILDRLILMAPIFEEKILDSPKAAYARAKCNLIHAKCYINCSLKGQHECNI